MSLKPYEEMNVVEVMAHWNRVRYAHCLNLYESPNRILWAVVDEAKGVTLQMWDVNTGHVIKQAVPESVTKTSICARCGHELRWQSVAVPPRWEHVRELSRDNFPGAHWICSCGCQTPEPKEAQP
jgi:hypothetical protein